MAYSIAHPCRASCWTQFAREAIPGKFIAA
jgi:hypothetical protein